MCLLVLVTTPAGANNTDRRSNRLFLGHRHVRSSRLRTNRSVDRKTSIDSRRTASNVNQQKNNKCNNGNRNTRNDGTCSILLEEARSTVAITDTTAIRNTRSKWYTVAIKARLIKGLVAGKQSQAALVDHAHTERFASAIKAACSISVTHATPVKNSIATRHAIAIKASRVAGLIKRIKTHATCIRRPARVGHTVAPCTTLSERVVHRVLAHATTVKQETTVGHIAAISTRLVEHGRFGFGERMKAVATGVELTTAVGPARAISTFLVKLWITESQAVAALVVAEVGERHTVAAQARLPVTTTHTANVKHQTAVRVVIAARARVITSRIARIETVATSVILYEQSESV